MGTFELEGEVVVIVRGEAWEKLLEQAEDLEEFLEEMRATAIRDDPDAVFQPYEEVRKELFENNIREVRQAKGMTQKELARKLRVSQARVSQIEDPAHRPSARVYERVAKALGVSVEELI